MNQRGRPRTSQVSAQAQDYFDKFCSAESLESILQLHQQLCEVINVKPSPFPSYFPKVMAALRSFDAQDLLNKYNKRASLKAYDKGQACAGVKVLIIGAGPCGLRTAIEAQLAGARVVLVEKRDSFSRNNVLHLWPFVITDLKNLGAKRFYGKFCPGAIDHISIAKLQMILLKIALIVGVEIHFSVGFEDLVEPCEEDGKKWGWRVKLSGVGAEHPVSSYEFDAVIGADGKRNTLKGFHRKVLRGKLAIAITANFVNKRSAAEAKVQEISGVSFIFKQDFFNELCQATGIDLENIVYYKDETHYFVMTAKKHSLLWKGVLTEDFAETDQLLAPSNINRERLHKYVMEAVNYSTNGQLKEAQFALNYRQEPDVAIIDFTAMHAAESACRVLERNGSRILLGLVGDSLLEPFWPTGSGCARGFLSSMDACWMLRSWAKKGNSPLEVVAERESIYRLLAQTTHENLSKDHNHYTIEPLTRYPHINCNTVKPFQVQGLLDSDVNPKPAKVEAGVKENSAGNKPETEKKDTVLRRSKTFCSTASRINRAQNRFSAHITTLDESDDELPDLDELIGWFREQVKPYEIVVDGIQDVFVKGDVLCAILHRFRPDLLPEYPLPPEVQQGNTELEQAGFRNQLAFDFIRGEFFLPCKVTGMDSVQNVSSNLTFLISYAVKIFEAFKHQKPRGIVKPRITVEEAKVVEGETDLKSVDNSNKEKEEDRFFTPPESPPPQKERSSTPSYVSSVWASTTTFFDPEEQDEQSAGRRVQRSSSIQRMVQRLDKSQSQAAIPAKTSPFGKFNNNNTSVQSQEEMRRKRLEEAEKTKVEALKMIHTLQCRQAEVRNDEQAEARQRYIRAMRAQHSVEDEPEVTPAKKAVEDDEFFNEYNMRLWRSSRPSINERTQNLEQKLLNTGLERKSSLREAPVKNQLLVQRGLQRSATENQMKTAVLPAHVQKFRREDSAIKAIQEKMLRGQGNNCLGRKPNVKNDDTTDSDSSDSSHSQERIPAPVRTQKQVLPIKSPLVQAQQTKPNPMKIQLNPGKLAPQQLKVSATEKKEAVVKGESLLGKLAPQKLKVQASPKKEPPPKIETLPGKLRATQVRQIEPKKPESSQAGIVTGKQQLQVTSNIKQVVARTDTGGGGGSNIGGVGSGIKKSFSTTHVQKEISKPAAVSRTGTNQNNACTSSNGKAKKYDFSEYFAAKAAAEAKAAERQAKRNERRLAQEARMAGQRQGEDLDEEESFIPASKASNSHNNVRSYALSGSKSFHQITSSSPIVKKAEPIAPAHIPQQQVNRQPQTYTRQTTLEEFDALLDITEEDEKILQDLNPDELNHLLDWTSKTIDVSSGVETF